jgi:hypothetical protein
MALKLRPNGLKHLDDERKDYTVHCRNLEIGRIYEVDGSHPVIRWFRACSLWPYKPRS